MQSQLVKLDEDGLSYIRLTMAQKFVVSSLSSCTLNCLKQLTISIIILVLT